MQLVIYKIFNHDHLPLYEEIYSLTEKLENFYPHYNEWFGAKFLEGLKRNEREYIVALNNRQELLGCALLKKTEQEHKISTLLVHPKYRRQGVGTALLKKSIEELRNKINITVNQSSLSQIKPLLLSQGFKLYKVQKDVYNKGDSEYYFCLKKSSKKSFRKIAFIYTLASLLGSSALYGALYPQKALSKITSVKEISLQAAKRALSWVRTHD